MKGPWAAMQLRSRGLPSSGSQGSHKRGSNLLLFISVAQTDGQKNSHSISKQAWQAMPDYPTKAEQLTEEAQPLPAHLHNNVEGKVKQQVADADGQ